MIPLPKPSDAVHKAWLLRILGAFYDSPLLANSLYFKGGTCAAMQGLILRFSVDLDFDYVGSREEMPRVREEMEKIFAVNKLTIANKSHVAPQYFLKYETVGTSERNTLKIDAFFPELKANKYETVLLPEVNRVVTCQDKETMFGNKLVALIDRHEKHGAVAGRDVFDIHSFFMKGFSYNKEVIAEQRPSVTLPAFFQRLISFVEAEVSQEVIDQDLNVLLPYDGFKHIRLILKQETITFLRDELARLKS